MSRYPELDVATRAEGISFACAYMRLEHGWDLARAISEPPRKRGPRKIRPIRLTREQRATARLARRLERMQQKVDNVIGSARPIRRRRRSPTHGEDTAPLYIQKIRAAFCAEFIRTGEINTELQNKLKEYADEQRSIREHSATVPAEPEADRYLGRTPGMGNHGPRGATETDRGAEELYRNFIQSR
jgi:hypothetical protein